MTKKGIFLSLILLSVVGIPTFIGLSFINSKDCSQLVIDTYELHSKINIPKVNFVNCHYDEALKIRISIYDLEEQMDLNAFKPVDPSTETSIYGAQLLNDHESIKGDQIYIASGERWGTKWTYVFDQVSKRLWAELKY